MGATDPIRSALTSDYVQTLLRIKARQLSRRPEFRRTDTADIEHDLLVHVLKQADNYNPTRSQPNTFITRVVETAAAMLIRSRKRLKRAAGNLAVSLEGACIGGDQDQTTLGEIISEDDLRRMRGNRTYNAQLDSDRSIDIAAAMEGLTPRQCEVAERLATSTEAGVARQMGISRRQVRNEVQAIGEHFTKSGLSLS